MNPLLQSALGAILRWALTFFAGYFVSHGIWSQSEANTYVMGAVMALLTLLWSLWGKYHSRIKFLTALESPAGTSEAEVKAKVNNGMGAPLALLVLAVALGSGMTSTGCAKTPPNVDPVAARQHQVLKVLNAVKQVGLVVEQVQIGEQNLYLAGEVPAGVHADIQRAFKETADDVLAATNALSDAATASDPAGVVQALADGLKRISLSLGHLSQKQGAQLAGWIDTAAALIEVALS